jgi:YVTN family beta-propeller protein
MAPRRADRGTNLATPRSRIFALVAVTLLAALLPFGSGGFAMGTGAAHPDAGPSHAVVGTNVPAPGLSERFPAPRGGPDPILSTGAAPAIVQQLRHRTEVASLVAHRGVGYAYASGVAWLAYAPWDQAFYVAAPPSSVDEILAGSTNVSAVIAVGTDPFGVAVDTVTDQVWVTNTGSNNVTVINGTNQAVVRNIAVHSEPLGIAVNPAQARVFVASNGTNTTIVIDASTGVVLANPAVGAEPIGVAFDATTDRVFVSDLGSDQVTILNGSTGTAVTNVSVGSEPVGLAVDNTTGTVYVANMGTNNVSVLGAATGTLLATVPVVANGFTPVLQGVTYDSVDRLVWVTAGFSAIVINTSQERVVDEVIYDPAGIAFDPANGDVCLTNSANVTFGCFDFGTDLQSDVNLTVSETGLPTGTTWNLTLFVGPWMYGDHVTQSITGTSFVFGLDRWLHAPGYNYSFAIQPVAGEAPNPVDGYVVAVGNRPSWLNVTFVTGSVYNVRFNESGLPYGVRDWSVTLGAFQESSTGSSLTYEETNGTYPFTTSGPTNWTSSPSHGNVTVLGRSINLTLNWTRSTGGGSSGGSGRVHNITLAESGLPSGTYWGAQVANASASSGTAVYAPESMVWDVYPGTYQYTTSAPVGWNASDGSGSIVVTNASVTVTIDWKWVGYYPVTFTETGLPNGTYWSVEIGELEGSSSTPSVVIDAANGTYALTIFPLSGYTSSTTNRTVTVEGSAVTVTVEWTVTVAYALTFQESGLASGTQWSVTLNGSLGTGSTASTTTSLTWVEPNGTYQYQVPPIAAHGQREYVATPSNGSVQLNGAARTVDLVFALSAAFFNVSFQEAGLPAGTLWSIGIAGVGWEATGTTIVAPELNGSYVFTTGGAFGYDPAPATGTVRVSGAAQSIPVNFTIAPGFYAVTFTESGLGMGTPWTVTIGSALSTTGPSLVFAEPNGSFPYTVAPVVGYRLADATGTVSVNGAAPPDLTVTFVSTDLYAITFVEAGLPHGTGWAVSIGSQLDSSLSANVTLLETNGTFGYLVLPVAGYTTTYSGFVVVAGLNRTVAVHFVPQTYPVVVVEFGLPNGTLWSVLVTNATTGFNATFSTSGNALIFDIPNGTYALSVHAGGYSANLSSPTFTVAGKLLGSSPTVRFVAPAGPGGPGRGGATTAFSTELAGIAIGAVVLVGAALGVLAAAWRRRAARREGSAWLRELADAGPESETEPRP